MQGLLATLDDTLNPAMAEFLAAKVDTEVRLAYDSGRNAVQLFDCEGSLAGEWSLAENLRVFFGAP